jgi:hypothetical protein
MLMWRLQGIKAEAVVLDDLVSCAFGPDRRRQKEAEIKLGPLFYWKLAEAAGRILSNYQDCVPVVTGKAPCYEVIEHRYLHCSY